jgi:single-strand DNA-binding protein
VSVCTFRIAVPRPYKRDETDYLSIVTWRAVAENCAKFLTKGRKVGVVGYIQTREYDSNGQRRYITEIVADEVEFLTPKGGAQGATEQDALDEELDDYEPLDDEQMPF